MSLKILMTADTAGGVWNHALSLCRGLAAERMRVELVALGIPDARQRAEASVIPSVTLHTRPVRLEWMQGPWSELDALGGELVALADAAGCDVVHLNHLVHGHLDWRRPVVGAVHSCVPSWFGAVLGQAPPPEWNAYRERVRDSLRAVGTVVAPSRWMLERAEQLHGPFRSGFAVANGSDAPLGDPESPREGVLGAGRIWDEAKNLGPLAARAAEIPAPVRLAGPTASPDGTTRPLDGATWLGELPQRALWWWMRRSAVFAAPARYEPFGLGVLEAARSGCALVLGDIPSLRENWDGAACFVDPERPEQWCAALTRLLDDTPERLALARAAASRAGPLTVAHMAQEYAGLYRDLAGTAVREAS